MRCLLIVTLALGGCQLVFDLEAPPDRERNDRDDAAVDAAPPLTCPETYTLSLPAISSRYRFDTTKRTFAGAAMDCRNDEGLMPTGERPGRTHLAVLDDDAERMLAASTFVSTQAWIGLSDAKRENAFIPVSTQNTGYPPLTAPPWGTGHPNDEEPADCVVVRDRNHDEPGMLEDVACGTPHAFLCECDDFADDPTRY